MCLNNAFNVMLPDFAPGSKGFILGSDGYFYARLKSTYIPSDGVPREFIVSFPASGNIEANGFYVYAAFTETGTGETSEHGAAAPNHLYSTIPPGEMDSFIESIHTGNPPPPPAAGQCMHFTAGRPNLNTGGLIPDVPYTIWDLYNPRWKPDGTPLPSS